MGSKLIITLSLLFFAIAESVSAKSEIDAQKVVLPESAPFHAIEPWDFNMTYGKFKHESNKIIAKDDRLFDLIRGLGVFLEEKKEHFAVLCKALIKYHERYGAFDNIHEHEKIDDYPYYIQDYGEGFAHYYFSSIDYGVKEIVNGGFELIEKEYGQPLTLKLKGFINHLVKLVNESPEGVSSFPMDTNTYDFYERLVDYIISYGEVLVTLEPQDEVKSMLKKVYLSTDLEHFATDTLQDVALMYFFWNEDTSYNPPPNKAPYMHLQPLSQEASRLAYAPLKGKSVDELVPILYNSLTAKRVLVMYHTADTPYLQALRKKYENMNYRDLAQWVHDKIERFYASSDAALPAG